MRCRTLLTALLAGGLVAGASAQTSGYLYFVGGGIDAPANATAEDGTLTSDNGVFSALVADITIDVSSVTITNWRYAAGATMGNPLPEDNPNTGATELYSWMFNEDATHVYNGRLYTGPGDWNGDGSRTTANAITHAPINPDGTLGTWTTTPPFPVPPAVADQAICATALVDFGGGDAHYYVLGGTGSLSNVAIVAPILGSGDLSTWTAVTNLPAGDWFNRATVSGSTIIHGSGNGVASRNVHYATATAGSGALGAWNSAGTYSAGGSQWDYVMVTAKAPNGTDYVVIAGGSALDGGVYTSPVTAGVPGAFTATNSLPTPVRRVTGVAIDDVVVVLGGTAGGSGVALSQDLVQVGRIDNAGAITWTDSTASATIDAMPQRRSFGGAAFAPGPSNVRAWELY